MTIDTACFLADGLENVASRMTYIFDRLNALEKTIILFDEVEGEPPHHDGFSFEFEKNYVLC